MNDTFTHSDDETVVADAPDDGADAARGRFVWNNPDCGTIYADSLDAAIMCAQVRLARHDAATSAAKALNTTRIGINETPSDWTPDA